MKLNSITQRLQRIRHGQVNRKYKDHLFRYVFQNKKDLLELYNAINGTSYSDPEELMITTLQDVVYLGMKNDVSFLIGSYMNLYSTAQVTLPTPKYVIFYNGTSEQPERMELL